MGADRVVFVDLHGPRAAAFFPEPIPVTNLQPQSLAINYLKRKVSEQHLAAAWYKMNIQNLQRPVVVSPDNASGERAKGFWYRMKKEFDSVGLATVVSNRPSRRGNQNESPIINEINGNSNFPTGSTKSYFVGDVKDRDCIVVDDLIDTGVRMTSAVSACKAAGAKRVYVYSTHGLLSHGAVQRLESSGAEEIILTNSIALPPHVYSNKIKILNISKVKSRVFTPPLVAAGRRPAETTRRGFR